MYSRNSFGSFYPVDSSVHRLNPVVKLFNFIIAILLMILSDSLYINLFLFSLVLCMELLSFVPFKYYFRTFWSLRYIYILIVFICIKRCRASYCVRCCVLTKVRNSRYFSIA